MPLTLGQMDHLKGSISDILNRFSPPCPQNLVKVKFVPVLRQQTVDYKKNIETWYKKERFQLDQDEDQPIHRRRKAIGVCWCDKAAKERRENGEESLKWVISIEIGIPPGIESRFNGKLDGVSDFNCALQYENEDGIAYLRIDAGTRRMGPFDISRHVSDQARSHYQPILDRLRLEIDAKLCYKSCLESDLENHQGMKKMAGGVIQPNIQRPYT